MTPAHAPKAPSLYVNDGSLPSNSGRRSRRSGLIFGDILELPLVIVQYFVLWRD
jgi:hypothetical protein